MLIGFFVLFFSSRFQRQKNPHTDYLAALIDKENHLNSLDSNRLILVGGSNLAFGIDSRLMEKKLSKQVANLGLHAGLSLPFMLNEASHLMKTGDVVVLNLEYPLYLDNFDPDIDLIQFAQELYPIATNYYEFTPKEMMVARYEKFKKYFHPDVFYIDPVFNRQSFNTNGDDTAHLNKKSFTKLVDRKPIGTIKIGKATESLNEFADAASKVGVTVLLSYPPYPATEYLGKNKQRLIELDSELHRALEGIHFLNHPQEYLFPDNMFYDTIFHLNKDGRKKRTELLIKDLEKQLN